MSRSEDDAAADDIIACTAAPYSSAEPREGAKAVRKSRTAACCLYAVTEQVG